jgi:hypothetical protein
VTSARRTYDARFWFPWAHAHLQEWRS